MMIELVTSSQDVDMLLTIVLVNVGTILTKQLQHFITTTKNICMLCAKDLD